MLLAFPFDYWDDEHIRGDVKDFGALISWDKEASSFGELIAKVRVVDLHCIPHSCVVSSGNEWFAKSWSVPIFILSQKLLGGMPADEDEPPADGSTTHHMPNVGVHGPVDDNVADVPVQQILDLNHAPPNVAFDLNAKSHQLDNDDFLELNDLINPVIQNHGPPLVVMGLPAPVQAQAQDVDMLPIEDNHSDLTLTISSAGTPSNESGGSVNGGPHNVQLPNLHIGMVLIPEIEVDHVAALSPVYGAATLSATPCSESADFLFSKEDTAAWSTHFKPDGSIVNTVNVPAKWVDFITAKLLTPDDFDCAKGLLQSKIWEIPSDFEIKSDGSAPPFALPRSCPTQAPPVCTLTLACEKATQGFMTPQAPRKELLALSHSSTSAIHFKKRGQKTPLVCSEVRRSSRIKAMNKGFNIPEESEKEESSEDEEEGEPVVATGKKQKHSISNCANASTKKNPKKK
ncbi:hypothetical protein ACQ4PT_063039 [Festuca glaucescens]